ncbi:MAG: hypothetical protein PHO15_00395 [Eubacteriales bacterium]|nr:hypothetical protein [Eubacteriales bacterium]
MSEVRRQVGLYTLTTTTGSETLSADTGNTTFTFAHTDLALNSFGAFYEGTTADSTLSTAGLTVNYSLGTLTVTAEITAGITVTEYQYFLWDYSQDNLIERQINSASAAVSKYCGRNFIADTYTEYYKGLARQKLVLNQYPVNSITSVTVNSAALTAGTDYVTSDSTYLNQGILFRDDGWPFDGYLVGLVGEPAAPLSNVGVVYSAGYTLTPETSRTLPYDLEDVVISMAMDMYNEVSNGSAGLKQLTQGKLTYVWKDDERVRQYSSTLDAYKKWVV